MVIFLDPSTIPPASPLRRPRPPTAENLEGRDISTPRIYTYEYPTCIRGYTRTRHVISKPPQSLCPFQANRLATWHVVVINRLLLMMMIIMMMSILFLLMMMMMMTTTTTTAIMVTLVVVETAESTETTTAAVR